LKKSILVIFLILSGLSYGQSSESSTTLADALKTLEQRYDVRFSYQSDLIDNLTVNLNCDDLKQCIDSIESQHSLEIKRISDRYYSIVQKDIQLCFTLYDAETDFSITNQVVTELNTSKSNITGVDGKITFVIGETKTLRIKIAGYQIVIYTYTGNETECIRLNLQPEVTLLTPIILNPILTNGIYNTDDGDVKLDVSQFGSLPGLSSPDALESIQSLPGIESVDESISNINVRGGGNDENLIVWDGIKMYNTGHFFGLISAFNPYAIDQITIIKNGTTAALGDSVSSTILMETNDDITGDFSGSVGLDLLSVDSRLTIPISDKLETQISLRRSMTDVIATPTFNRLSERSFQNSNINQESNLNDNIDSNVNFSFYDTHLKVLYDINDNHRLRLSGIHISNQLEYNEQLNDTMTFQNFESSLNQLNSGITFSYDATLSQRFNMNVMAYYSQFELAAVDKRINEDQRLQQLNEVIENGVKINSQFVLKKANGDDESQIQLNTGYHFYELGTLNTTLVDNPSFISRIRDVLLNHAAWTQLSIRKKAQWNVEAGLRYNYYQDFKRSIIEPRFKAFLKVAPALKLNARGELKSQSIAQIIDFDNDFLGVENRRWQVADEETTPIVTSSQASSGLLYQRRKTTLQLDGFFKIVNDITAQSRGLFSNLDTSQALGSYTSTGIEFFAQQRTKNITGWMSYAYSVNNFNFDAFVPSNFPATTDVRHSIQMGFTYSPMPQLELDLGAQYHTGLPFTRPVNGDPTRQQGAFTLVNYEGANQSQLADYFRLDATIKYRLKLENNDLIAQLGLRNITNSVNEISRLYSISTIDNSVVETINYGLPFTPNFSLRYEF